MYLRMARLKYKRKIGSMAPVSKIEVSYSHTIEMPHSLPHLMNLIIIADLLAHVVLATPLYLVLVVMNYTYH